jgi:uncharacterized membrane protein
MRQLATQVSAFLAKSEDALARNCWALYGSIPPCFALLMLDVLQPIVTVLLIGTMIFSYARIQHALGTLYVSHLENAIYCKAVALSTVSAGQIILPVLEGYTWQFVFVLYLIPIVWALHRLAVGAFMLSRKRSVLGQVDD